MNASPVLKIHISPSDKGEQFCCLRLTLSDDPEIDAGTLKLPFPLQSMPAIQKVLNLRQSPVNISKNDLFEDDFDKEKVLQDLGLLDKYGRICPDVHQRVGKKLGSALLDNQVFKDSLQTFYKAVREPDGGDIVLIFDFDPAALKLAVLPWELAYYGSEPLLMHLGAEAPLGCTRVVIDQSINLTEQSSLKDYTLRDKLRILAVASYWEMDERDRTLAQRLRQKATFSEAFEDTKIFKDNEIKFDSVVDFDPEEYITLNRLQSKLSEGSHIDILDYYGHGSFENGNATLRMGNVNSGLELVPATKLKSLIYLPPLVVLHACNSAQLDIDEVFDSLALSLNGAGVQAVVAMQFEIQMLVVLKTVVPSFYNALAKGYSLPKAVAEVRQMLYREPKDDVSWFVPVLYMREFDQRPYLKLEPTLPPRNPFADPGALKDSKLFVGRKKQVQQLRLWLPSKSHLSIVGPDGSGKSSMLMLIRAEVSERTEAKVEIVKLSPRRKWKLRDAEEDLAQELQAQRRKLKGALKGKDLILLLDDIDKLTECEEGYDICDWLRTLAEEGSDYNIRLVVTSRKPLREMLDKVFRPLSETIIEKIELGLFNKDEARDFILVRLKQVGNPFEVENFDDLLDSQISLMPKKLQDACYNHYEKICTTIKRVKILFP